MSLKAQIQDDVKKAMKARDRARLGVLRLITASIKQIEVDQRVELDDAAVTQVLDKMVKQRRESLAQYQQAGRDDLAEQEQFELDLIATYLPEPLSQDQIQQLISEAIATSGAQGMADMGKVMGLLKPHLQGRADMKSVSATVRSLLAG